MEDRRRQHPRVPLEVEVTLESEHNFYAGIAGNVSEGGIFVATYAPPERGALVEVKLTLLGAEFTVNGVVCWRREVSQSSDEAPAGCGIKFLELTQDALRQIGAFVQHRDTILFDED